MKIKSAVGGSCVISNIHPWSAPADHGLLPTLTRQDQSRAVLRANYQTALQDLRAQKKPDSSHRSISRTSSPPHHFQSTSAIVKLPNYQHHVFFERILQHRQLRQLQVRRLRCHLVGNQQQRMSILATRNSCAILILSTQGNHYCSRDYGSSASNSNSYHYSNSDGRYVHHGF